MTEVQQRLTLWTLTAVIVVSLAISLARTTWHLAGETGAATAPVIRVSGIDGGPALVDTSPIVALAPFGQPAQQPNSPPKETALGLTLGGVVLADPPTNSQAVITGSDGVAHVYSVGDAIPGGAVLESVLADGIVLRVAGQLETLSFPKAFVSPGVAAIRAQIPASVGGSAPNAGVTVTPSPASELTQGKIDPDAVVENFRKRIAVNPQTVLNDVGLSATSEGYKLEDSMMPELRRAGLKPGDVVVRVNGKNVGNVESDRALFDDVVASGRARVEVMRDGSLIAMSFPLR